MGLGALSLLEQPFRVLRAKVKPRLLDTLMLGSLCLNWRRALWRQAQLNATEGLFQGTAGVLSGSRFLPGEYKDR
jgi:hypothetical protein